MKETFFSACGPGFGDAEGGILSSRSGPARLTAELLTALDPFLAAPPDGAEDASDPPSRGLFPGAVVLVRQAGTTLTRAATGYAVRYADRAGTDLPPDRRVAMTPETIFDVASISKLFTAVAAMPQVEAGRLDLDAPVAAYLPEFAAGGKDRLSVRQLFTHTTGLPATLPLWRDAPDPAARIRAALTTGPVLTPGSAYLYSDLNLIALGRLAERVGGAGLDELVATGITEPLGMADTGYRPGRERWDRIAATEYTEEPPRGLIRGEVHDENAWSLGGIAGHAGVFSTADDLVRLTEAILAGGRGEGGQRILAEETVVAMLGDANPAFPANSHGLGPELDQRWYMGELAGPQTFGHTGFTGTSLVVEPTTSTVVCLLTNRVHPSRSWGGVNGVRRTVARHVAAYVGKVAPRTIGWRLEPDRGAVEAPTARVETRHTPTRLTFDLFLAAEEAESPQALAAIGALDGTDELPGGITVEISDDDGRTWRPLSFRISHRGTTVADDNNLLAEPAGRSWLQASSELDGVGTRLLWWTHRRKPSDERATSDRGVHVDGVRLADRFGRLEEWQDTDLSQAFFGRGWRQAHDRSHTG